MRCVFTRCSWIYNPSELETSLIPDSYFQIFNSCIYSDFGILIYCTGSLLDVSIFSLLVFYKFLVRLLFFRYFLSSLIFLTFLLVPSSVFLTVPVCVCLFVCLFFYDVFTSPVVLVYKHFIFNSPQVIKSVIFSVTNWSVFVKILPFSDVA